MWGVGFRAQHSSGFSAVKTNRKATSSDENGRDGKGIRPPVTMLDQPAPPASRYAPHAHRVRALRRGQPGGREGGHAARPARARHRPRRDRRDARRERATGRRIAAAPTVPGVERLEATWESLRGDEVFPGRPAVAGVEPPHPRRPPLLQPGPPRHLPAGRRPPTPSTSSSIPLRVVARRPRHRRGSGVRPRAAPARPAGRRRPPGALPARSATTAAPWSTARSSTPCRCGTPCPGRSTGST